MKPDPRFQAETFDPDEYVRSFPREALLSSEGRRRLTRYDPTLFALIYFRDSLRSDATGGRITLSQFHLDAARSALRWAKTGIGPMEVREAWVAPRESGKSTWNFLILPAWALAHGHRRYVAAFADNATMAKNHLATFKRKVQTENVLLRRDFPALCQAARRPGGVTDSDRQDLYLAKSGAVFQASGITSTTLGAKVGDQRPDLLLFDDIEPPASEYSPAQKDDRLSLVREAVFPMNLNAVVVFAGTVTMDGSIMHDIVRQDIEPDATSPEWVRAERITTRYYPALVPTDDGREVSLWPARWSTEFLIDLRRRSPRVFALNYMNRPVPLDSAYWTEDMFTRGMPQGLTRHILAVDPAVTTNRSSDFTGLAVISWSAVEKRAVVRHTEMVKLSPTALRRHVLGLLARFPYVRMILIETTQGGDTWTDSVFHDMPVPIDQVKPHEKKELRWAGVLDLWTSQRVLHDPDGQLLPFEQQALAVPKSANDDVCDAVVAGVHYVFTRFDVPKQAPRPKSRTRAYVHQ